MENNNPLNIDNIHLDEFVKILEGFKQQGARTFGIEISDNGKNIKLYPILRKILPPSSPPKSTDSEDDDLEADGDISIKNLKT